MLDFLKDIGIGLIVILALIVLVALAFGVGYLFIHIPPIVAIPVFTLAICWSMGHAIRG